MTGAARLVTLTLGAVMAASILAKLAGGHQPYFAVSRSIYFVALVAELLLLCGLAFPRLRAWSAFGIGTMAAAGVLVALFGDGRACGCLGTFLLLSPGQHMLLSSSVGALAVLVWRFESDRTQPKRGDGNPMETAAEL